MYSLTDRILIQLDQALRTALAPAPRTPRAYPAEGLECAQLSEAERRHVGGLMRINHTGEVCAQALYHGQAATARDDRVKTRMRQAAEEEADHLYWCRKRLDELADHPSHLNLLWYAGSWLIGAGAGIAGDRWSLGFVIETENQVEAHLDQHLQRLPAGDARSRAILEQMKADEVRHARMAEELGGLPLPQPVRRLMKCMADGMKAIAYRF